MIKEILKGNKIILKEENKLKKNNTTNLKVKDKNRRINSVLNNYLLFKKINLTRKPKQNKFENTKSLKIIINKKNDNSSYKKLTANKSNNTLTDSNIYYNKSSIRTNYSYTLKSKKDISRELLNVNSINFDKKINTLQNSFNKLYTNEFKNISNQKIDNSFMNEEENENGCGKKKYIFLREIDDNALFLNNLEQEFEIRCLKKRLETLKKNNVSLTQKLNNIVKKNYFLQKETIKEQNKRKNIICSTINICNKYSENNVYEEESDYKNLLLNIMDKKYNFDILKLNNFFYDSIKELLLCSNIFNDNKILNKNNIYLDINNLVRLKTKYINEIKEYNEINKKNENYYNYCLNLCENLNINDLNSLYKYLTKIKSNNDDEMKKIIKMKHVLFDEKQIGKRKLITRASEDNLNRKKNAINFNYADLQKYFIESNKKNEMRTNSTKASKLSIGTEKEKINNCAGSLTDRASHKGEDVLLNYNKTTKNSYDKINYYRKTREQLENYRLNCPKKILHQINSFNFKDRVIKIRTEEENDKENNLLYYSYKHKLRNIPHNNRTFQRIEIQNNINQNNNSSNNLISFNKSKIKRKSMNRIKQFKLNLLNNNNNNISNKKLQVKFFTKYNKYNDIENIQQNENFNINDNRKTENENKTLNINNSNENNKTYNNIIENKKKSLNLIIPSLRSVKNYRTIIFNGQ